MTDENGLPICLTLTSGQTHDAKAAYDLIKDMKEGQMLLADKAYDADWLREFLSERGAWANIPPRSNRSSKPVFSPYLYKARNQIERFFNKLKYFRRIAIRYGQLGSSYLAMVKIAAIRIRLRFYESTA